MSQCNEIAQQYIAALSNQIDFLAAWDLAALGALLATAFGIVLHNQANPEKSIRVRYWPLWVSVVFLGLSLLSSYGATNGLTQAIPEICSHNFEQKIPSLRDESKLYKWSVRLMQWQYFLFGIAAVFTIVLIVVNRRVLHARQQSKENGSENGTEGG